MFSNKKCDLHSYVSHTNGMVQVPSLSNYLIQNYLPF
jgi:hypothetical protein